MDDGYKRKPGRPKKTETKVEVVEVAKPVEIKEVAIAQRCGNCASYKLNDRKRTFACSIRGGARLSTDGEGCTQFNLPES